MKIATIKQILETKQFNKNFNNSVGDLTYQIGETRLREASKLGFVKDGEYLIKENRKIFTSLLNFRVCSDKTFREVIIESKNK